MKEKHITKILQYWEKISELEKDIRQLKAKYVYVDPYRHDEWSELYNEDTERGVRYNKKIKEEIDKIKHNINKLEATYEKWLMDKLNLKLNDRNQDEFVYNLINSGIILH
jgi:archaellum component FlaC